MRGRVLVKWAIVNDVVLLVFLTYWAVEALEKCTRPSIKERYV